MTIKALEPPDLLVTLNDWLQKAIDFSVRLFTSDETGVVGMAVSIIVKWIIFNEESKAGLEWKHESFGMEDSKNLDA